MDTEQYEKDKREIWEAIGQLREGQNDIGEALNTLREDVKSKFEVQDEQIAERFEEMKRDLANEIHELDEKAELRNAQLKVAIMEQLTDILKNLASSVPVWIMGIVAMGVSGASIAITWLLMKR